MSMIMKKYETDGAMISRRVSLAIAAESASKRCANHDSL